ncbi:MAG TPA: efflux RND transporter periplasmic adaptor subunit, partial [Candidatus Ozemobacteraceae bacterium]|nr:efflux RND transporter periplasmic adaptor subunit [Candidatus Ozemobacteraceae bacterium]
IMPVSGEEGKQGRKTIEKGVTVELGTVLLAVGNLDGFRVKSLVEENNIAKLKIGQTVTVSEDAYPEVSFPGRITHISSQASGGGRYGQAATFEVVTVVEPVSPEHRHLVRVGLSATLQVTAYDRPDALVVPLSAVLSLDDGHFVMRRDPTTKTFVRVPIVPGVATLDVVEVRDGLQADDQLAANPGDLTKL